MEKGKSDGTIRGNKKTKTACILYRGQQRAFIVTLQCACKMKNLVNIS